jgi:DNA-directed RNA polymerase subunit RPC12/RpoP
MRYITLTTVNDIYEAKALSDALAEKGIRCIEANEYTSTMLPHLRQGIQIRVIESDYENARVISDTVEKSRLVRCPNCDSNAVKHTGEESKKLNVLERIVSLLHLPIRKHLLLYQCSNCGTNFKVN